MENYPISYTLPVEVIKTNTLSGVVYQYKNKETGEYHTGWFHCGCCGQDGFASTSTPTCTGCANKLKHGRENDSPMSVEYIQAYCDYWNGKLAEV